MPIQRRIKRMDRDELYKAWEDPKHRKEILQKAEEDNITPHQLLEQMSPTDPEKHRYQAIEEILYRRGYDLYDTDEIESSQMKHFGRWSVKDSEKGEDELRDQALLDEHFNKCYAKTLVTGAKTANVELVKSIQSVGNITAGTPLNPIYDGGFIRAKLFGAAIDFRRIVGDIKRIRQEVYRLPKTNNDPEERKMDRMAEATQPRFMELAYTDQTLTFSLFRKGIEATYDYLSSEQTRVSMVRNAIEEIAEQHRIALFELIVTAIKNACLSSQKPAHGGTSQKITFGEWLDFRKMFGNMYSPDIVLGVSKAITQFELMAVPMGTGYNIPLAQLAMLNPNLARNPQVLNNVPLIPEYGWYDDLPSDILEEYKLLTFDRGRSSEIVFQIGSDQDETKREPGPRVVQRFLATKAGVQVPDPNGIWELNFA